jgi:DNA-binding transcriptional ArsR family regulator
MLGGMMPDQSLSQLAEKAGQAAALLKTLSNEKRLLILCHLIAAGEMSVGASVSRPYPSIWRVCAVMGW